MKKITIFAVCFCILITPTSWSQIKEDQDENLFKQVTKLKKEVERLEKRVQYLEKLFESLEKRMDDVPRSLPRLKKIPKGWREYEYEGLKYYLVPLEKGTKKK